jgi:membrane protein DedA with SNARE-associated domain
MIGSMVGGTVDWWFGTLVADRREGAPGRWLSRPGVQERLDSIVDKFERHGAKFLGLNRFLPAFRALFFVAAGIARLRLREVVLWAAVSAAAWNGLLMVVGWSVGYNLESLVQFVEQYTKASLGGVIALAIGWLIYQWIRSQRSSS